MGLKYRRTRSTPWIEDSFLLELAQAQLIRQIFARHPIKRGCPPMQKRIAKVGDIFLLRNVHDATKMLFNSLSESPPTSRSSSSEIVQVTPIHNPMMMDRYLSLKATKYVYTACKHLGDEISFKPDGIVAKRAVQVLDEAAGSRGSEARLDLGSRVGKGAFADVKRTRTGGRFCRSGRAKQRLREPDLEALEAVAPHER